MSADLKTLNSKNNFLGLASQYCSIDNSRFAVVPAAFERTTSYRKGTYWGPKKFLEASKQLELYDEELGGEIALQSGVVTTPILKPKPSESTPTFFKRVTKIVDRLLNLNKFVITVGGEHTLTYAPVAAFVRHFPNLTILHFDAHADLRQSYEDTEWSHACALRRSLDLVQKAVLVGIRSFDSSEISWIHDNKNRVKVFPASVCQNIDQVLPQILDSLGEQVYITIDVDGLDVSLMPGVGTPQPGGLDWYAAIKLFRAVFEKKNVVGFDVLELAPIAGSVVSEFTAAKLAYRLMGYAWKFQKNANKAKDANKANKAKDKLSHSLSGLSDLSGLSE